MVKIVKMENANFSLPHAFLPKTCTTSTISAVESSRNLKTFRDHAFFSVHGQIQSPDSSAEAPPPRRTSRKRTRPMFYEPPTRQQKAVPPRRKGRPPKVKPPAPPCRRGRPPAALQEAKTINSNEVPPTPLTRPQGQIPWFITPVRRVKERSSSQANSQVGEHCSHINTSSSPDDPVGQETYMNGKTRGITIDKNREKTIKRSTFHTRDHEETLVDNSLNEVPGNERVRSAGCKNKMSEGIDTKILQHAANALQYMTGSQTSVEGKILNPRSSDFDKNIACMLKAINKKHGDITQDCSLESDCMKTLVLIGICKVVQDLQKKQLKELDISSLDSYYTAVRDAENMKVNVQWLHNRLDEIKDAVTLSNEAKGMVNERNRRLENIGRKKKELLLLRVELERLKSEVQGIEEQLAQESMMVEELNKKLGDQMSKISQFQHMYLMDGLV